MFDAFKDYLNKYLDMVEAAEPATDPKRLQEIKDRQIAYLQYASQFLSLSAPIATAAWLTCQSTDSHTPGTEPDGGGSHALWVSDSGDGRC